MIDIDFRYVMREKLVASENYGGGALVKKVPVLQWRKLVHLGTWNEDDGTQKPIGKWTDWQDVRTEEE